MQIQCLILIFFYFRESFNNIAELWKLVCKINISYAMTSSFREKNYKFLYC